MPADLSVPPLQLLSRRQSFGTHHLLKTHTYVVVQPGGGGVVLPYALGTVKCDYRVLFWPDAFSCTTLAVVDRREGLADIRTTNIERWAFTERGHQMLPEFTNHADWNGLSFPASDDGRVVRWRRVLRVLANLSTCGRPKQK